MKCVSSAPLALFAGTIAISAMTAHAQVTIGPDAGGYEATDSVTFSFDDISSTGATPGTAILDGATGSTPAVLVPLGFTFNFYGAPKTDIYIHADGLLSFDAPIAFDGSVHNMATEALVPDSPAIAVLWDTAWNTVAPADQVYYLTTGTAGSQQFIVQWNNIEHFFADLDFGGTGATFQVVLSEGSDTIEMRYLDTLVEGTASPPFPVDNGAFASIGIRNSGGNVSGEALNWSFNSATIMSGDAIRFEQTVASNNDPVCDAGADITIEADSPNGAYVVLSGTASDVDVADTLTYEWSFTTGAVIDSGTETTLSPSGSFPKGITIATLTVTDDNGGMCTSDVEIEVTDTTPPEITCRTNRRFLWIPNHRMRTVKVFVEATDAVTAPEDIMLVLVTVRSNEPDNGSADGNTTGDVNGQDGYTSPVPILLDFNPATQRFEGKVKLRAERSGNGNGRRYTIDVEAFDTCGNYTTAGCVVVVPRLRWWFLC